MTDLNSLKLNTETEINDLKKQLIESAGCRLLFLPPYSPDLNPIERFWSALKARIRRLLTDALSLDEAIDQAFKMAQ